MSKLAISNEPSALSIQLQPDTISCNGHDTTPYGLTAECQVLNAIIAPCPPKPKRLVWCRMS